MLFHACDSSSNITFAPVNIFPSAVLYPYYESPRPESCHTCIVSRRLFHWKVGFLKNTCARTGMRVRVCNYHELMKADTWDSPWHPKWTCICVLDGRGRSRLGLHTGAELWLVWWARIAKFQSRSVIQGSCPQLPPLCTRTDVLSWRLGPWFNLSSVCVRQYVFIGAGKDRGRSLLLIDVTCAGLVWCGESNWDWRARGEHGTIPGLTKRWYVRGLRAGAPIRLARVNGWMVEACRG